MIFAFSFSHRMRKCLRFASAEQKIKITFYTFLFVCMNDFSRSRMNCVRKMCVPSVESVEFDSRDLYETAGAVNGVQEGNTHRIHNKYTTNT